MKNFTKTWSIFYFIAFLSIIACANEAQPEQAKTEEMADAAAAYSNGSYLQSVQWLNANLDSPNLVIVDARSPEDYADGHVAGAVNAQWPYFCRMSEPANPTHGLLLPNDQLSEKIAGLGIDKNSKVVVYTDPANGFGEDGRLVWMFKYAGIEDVAMINGGISAYTSLNYELSQEMAQNEPTDFKIDQVKEEIYATTEYVIANRTHAKLLDTREREEFLGDKVYGEVRYGRIDGAKHIFYKDFMTADGFLQPQQKIESMLSEAGITKDDPVIVYCTGGIRAGFVAIVMEIAGYTNVRNYDGSMWNWAADSSLEMVKG